MAVPKFAPRYKPAHIATQGHEVKAMVEILNADYKDVQTAARAAVSAGLAMVAARSWWVIASTLDGSYPTFYGLFATEGAAQKALDANALGLFGLASIHEVRGLDERAFDIKRWEDEVVSHSCIECGHVSASHDPRPATRRGAGTNYCITAGSEPGSVCGCPRFVGPAPTIPTPSVV